MDVVCKFFCTPQLFFSWSCSYTLYTDGRFELAPYKKYGTTVLLDTAYSYKCINIIVWPNCLEMVNRRKSLTKRIEQHTYHFGQFFKFNFV